MSCDCKEPVNPDSRLGIMTNGVAKRFVRYCSENACSQTEALDRLSARTSTTVSARLPNAQLAQLKLLAEKRGTTTGQLIRAASMALLAATHVNVRSLNADAARMLRDVLKALELPASATLEDASKLLASLFELATPPDTSAPAPSGDAAPEIPDTKPVALSAHARALAAKMSPAQRAEYLKALAIRDAARAREKTSRARQRR